MCVLLLCLERSPPLSTPIVQVEDTATALPILRDFGLEGLAQGLLAVGGVHSLGNLLSLGTNVHRHFDCLELYSSKVPARCVIRRPASGINLTRTQSNCYNVCVSHDRRAPSHRWWSSICHVLSQRMAS